MKKTLNLCLLSTALAVVFMFPSYASTLKNQNGLIVSEAEHNEPQNLDASKGVFIEAPAVYEQEVQFETKELSNITDTLFL